jgi:hypothetical protein
MCSVHRALYGRTRPTTRAPRMSYWDRAPERTLRLPSGAHNFSRCLLPKHHSQEQPIGLG